MRRIRVSTIATVAAAVALAGWSASAWAIEKPFQIGLGGGVSVPVGDAGDALKSGWHGTVIARFNLPGIPFDLRALGSYKHMSLDQAAAGSGGTSKIISGLGNITYTMPLPGPVKPYITAGLGAFNVKTTFDAAGVPDPGSTTKFGIDAGAGVQFGLMGLHGFVEGKFENVYTDQGFNPAVTQNLKTQIIPVTFGVFF
ncbi:MAG TPA: outer membrane beta-barrel protein [Candidatus Eisenbacteria bacterium]|nr:outer membrane beta-barrel protein [Candidatus Eisenbacteria bacterium]